MMGPLKGITLLLCVLTTLIPVKAQQRFLPPAEPTDTTMCISLLTCAPGSDIYELEGHSGLRMQYGANDLVANWGLFDFSSPGFVYRFVKGETDYSVGVTPTPYFLEQYRRSNRRVNEQILNLTPAECARVIDLVNETLGPDKRVYRYNYVLDNCATRVLAIVEKATGTQIELHSSVDELGESPTFRKEMRLFHANYPWYQFGIDVALGSGLDQTIDRRLTMFAPVVLERLAADATITLDGHTRPLVCRTTVLVEGPANGTILPPTPWYATPLAAALAILLVTVLITARDRRRKSLSRWFDLLLYGLMGLAGCVVFFLVFISTHEASSPNWLILWLTPLAFVGALCQWSKRCIRLTRLYHIYNIAATLLLAFVLIGGIQTGNIAFYPLMAAGIIRSVNFLKLTGRK